MGELINKQRLKENDEKVKAYVDNRDNFVYQGVIEALDSYQPLLAEGDGIIISPSNQISVDIKTINNTSISGSGNLNTGKVTADVQTNSTSIYEGADNSVQISKDSNNTIRIQGYGKDDRGQSQTLYDMSLTNKNYVDTEVAKKQDTLVSGINIKTINNESILGSGNINIQGGGVESAIIDVDNFTMTKNEFVQLFFTDKLLYIRDGGKNHLVNGKYNWTLLPEEEYELSYLEGNTIITHQFEVSDDVYYRGKSRKSAGVDIAVGKEKWYGTYTDENNVTYQVYTKTVYIPALPATAGITTYPHGVTNIKQILDAYGFTTDGFVLNSPRQNVQDNIAIYQIQKSATGGIAIEVGKDRSSKSAYVTMVYAKNN